MRIQQKSLCSYVIPRFAAFAILASSPAFAATTLTWTGSAGNTNWTDVANWNPGQAPAVGDTFVFNLAAGGTVYNNITDTNFYAQSLTFSSGAGAFALSGNKMRITGLSSDGTSNHTISMNLVMSGNRNYSIKGAGQVTLAGIISDQTTSNKAGIQKTNDGTLVISGVSNTYTNITSLQQGTLVVKALANGGQASSIGASASDAANLILGNSGAPSSAVTLRYTGDANSSTDRLFTLYSQNATIESAGAGTVQFSNTGAAVVAGSSSDSTLTLTLRGTNTGKNTMKVALGDSSSGAKLKVTKDDAGTWVLGGANTYTGVTEVKKGTLIVNGSLASTGTVLLSGTEARLAGTGSVGNITVNLGGILAAGDGGIGKLSANTVTFNKGSTFEIQLASDGSTGAAGVAWDQISATGNVTFAALDSDNRLVVKLSTLTAGNEPGLLAGWDPNSDHIWTSIVVTSISGSIANATTERFVFDTTGFAGVINGEFSFTRTNSNRTLNLVYTSFGAPIPEPATCALPGALVIFGYAALRRRARR